MSWQKEYFLCHWVCHVNANTQRHLPYAFRCHFHYYILLLTFQQPIYAFAFDCCCCCVHLISLTRTLDAVSSLQIYEYIIPFIIMHNIILYQIHIFSHFFVVTLFIFYLVSPICVMFISIFLFERAVLYIWMGILFFCSCFLRIACDFKKEKKPSKKRETRIIFWSAWWCLFSIVRDCNLAVNGWFKETKCNWDEPE